MNFFQYKEFRERALTEKKLQRLDCLNPFLAMDFARTCPNSTKMRASPEAAVDAWCDAMNFDDSRKDFVVPVEGVRAALHSLFRLLPDPNTQLWLPTDVYPFYQETAHNVFKGKGIYSFPTMPEPDLTALYQADTNAVVVITDPISPLGRPMNEEEVSFLTKWLQFSKDRLLVIDSVYDYDTELPASTRALYETGQVMVLHSLSKAWIQRAVFGVVILPLFRTKIWREVFEKPSSTAAALAVQAFAQDPQLPQTQQALFQQEWDRLAPSIKEMDPEFSIEGTGYLRPVRINYLKAMDKFGAMVVPGTVFGSNDPNLSIVSCLYEMKNQYGEAS